MSVQYQKQWKIPSDNGGDKSYTVSLTMDNRYKCSCPHWIFRLQKTGDDCKHIMDVKDGLYDDLLQQEFELVLAQVRQVTLQDDRVTVYVPLRPIGDTDFFATIIYDLIYLGVPWSDIREFCQVPRQWSKSAVVYHVHNHKRKIWGPEVEDANGHRFYGFETMEA